MAQSMERGSTVNDTGRFVGKAPRSSQWVWYPGSDQSFESMCELFDRIYPAN